MKNIIINFQYSCKKKKGIPKENFFLKLINKNFLFFKKKEITIRFVNKKEIQKLNLIYRKKNKPTNIISFPCYYSSNNKILGDLIFCKTIIENEAINQKKNIYSHWAHISLHGILHLLGYDHLKKKKAILMENLEIKLLKNIGYSNPYKTKY